MGLFDFMKKDKKEESKNLDKNNDNNESKSNKSKSKGFFNRKSDNKEDINPFNKSKITENEYKLAKKRRQEKDVRTDDEKIKDSAMKDMAYGVNAQGSIEAFSTLIFKVKLIEVK